ncbi:PhzF family phenazine biosynthesis protein [Chengkuizengella axinellae]|uniref:PhzF family phenazine biosynthesis protein n=1 Tax=Chengkuizengella axinellae TaxID=3064388 RepID=A0ABT9IYQ3_9BACL|nr:PhzF family phenazine biosynthesis protein [Chengkuizengella sp. 2205SS18-9]MDP5273930.1 PhzF family phenazine biosynthesis protein [Chengkuizengella sp. 2205SS18-9]
MKTEVYTLNAFTNKHSGGNEAGVVLQTKQLKDHHMVKIANDLGFSETAFVFPSETSDFLIRYFTPTSEVDICGHATIATFSLLKQLNFIKDGALNIDTKAGKLKVESYPDGKVFLEQNLPAFLGVLPQEEISSSLGIKKENLISDFPIQIVSTGLKDILVPVNNLKILQEMNPNMEIIAAICKEYGVTGYHVFTLETMEDSSAAHCRNFAPLYDIPEESATGTSNAALACYLYKYDSSINVKENHVFSFEQGYIMQKPSEVIVRITVNQGQIATVKVGGLASSFNKEIVKL